MATLVLHNKDFEGENRKFPMRVLSSVCYEPINETVVVQLGKSGGTHVIKSHQISRPHDIEERMANVCEIIKAGVVSASNS